MKTIMITGANRGIGYGLVSQYLEAGFVVIATYRKDLGELEKHHQKDSIYLIQMDVTDPDSISNAFKTIASKVDHLDILINNAGRYGKDAQKSLDENFDFEDMALTYKTNTLGPLAVTQNALSLLKKGSTKKIFHISSKVGSIADNQSGSNYGYRASKTALNMINKNISIELKKDSISSIVLHPGWVQTDMGGPQALVSVDQSAQQLFETMDMLGLEQTGQFFERDASPIAF